MRTPRPEECPGKESFAGVLCRCSLNWLSELRYGNEKAHRWDCYIDFLSGKARVQTCFLCDDGGVQYITIPGNPSLTNGFITALG